MADPVKVPFWKTNEGRKDIAVLVGLAGDILNYFSPHIAPGLSTIIGLALRAILNLIGNPQATQAPMILALVLMSAVLSPRSVMANPIGVPVNPGPVGSSEDALLMAPIGALEFNPSNSNNYGLALSESLVFGNVIRVDDSHVAISPFVFVGLFGAANIGEWVNTNGGAAWNIDYGVMVGLPKLDTTLPEVAFSATWNSEVRGSAKMMINVAFPVDILPDVLCRKINL